jgi:DNA-binding NtrC family response regulator
MHIGVVEDNPSVLSMLETALALHGHNVEAYSERSAFLSALGRSGRIPAFDLVLVDLFLDSGSGIDVIEALRLVQPRIPAILISAAEENVLAPIRKRYPDLPILRKPFKMQELISLVDKTTSS